MLDLYVTSSLRKVGKTFITAGIAATMQSLGYTTSVYKPIQTSAIEKGGFMQSSDLAFVSTIDPYVNTHFSYLFKSMEEPLVSSELENDAIDTNVIIKEYKKISATSDCTLVDGDGGILSPLAFNIQNVDLLKSLSLPALIVTNSAEDAVNSTLMTIESAQAKGVEVRGVIINDIGKECSKVRLNSVTRVIEEYSNIKVSGIIPHMEERYSPEDLITVILNGVDIESIFNVKIEKLEL